MSRHEDRQQLAPGFELQPLLRSQEDGSRSVKSLEEEQMPLLNVVPHSCYQALGVLHNGGRLGFVGVPHYNNRALGSTFAQNISVAGGAASVTTYDKFL